MTSIWKFNFDRIMDTQLQKTYPRDVFMHLLNTITLYVSVYGILNLVFNYINAAFPDTLNPYYNPGDSIRWTLSLFIIVFGVFAWTSWFMERDLVKNPDKADFRIRRWLIYLTIFLAALLLIGDLVALVYNFLGGDLTVPFILKVAAVLVVGAAVFWYYLYDLKKAPGAFSPNAKAAVWGSMIAALAVIVYGFYLAGPPFTQRLVRFDSQRVMDLQTIQSQALYYWQQKNKLPVALDDLRDPISGFVPPKDPDTDAPYEYRTTGDLSFELCAAFALASKNNVSAPRAAPDVFGGNWDHGAGRTCFERTIDAQLYGNKPVKPPAR